MMAAIFENGMLVNLDCWSWEYCFVVLSMEQPWRTII